MTPEILIAMVDLYDVLLALVAALLALVLSRRLREWRGSWRARRRAARAGSGEDAALDLLEAAGFVVVERQARVVWAPLVDGEPQHCELRADYRNFRVERIQSSKVLEEPFDQDGGRLFREWSALPKLQPAG